MSSKPICYWITQAPYSELSQKIKSLTRELSQHRDQFGYHVTADVLDEHVPQLLATRSRTLAVGILLALVLTHPTFFNEMRDADPDPAHFEAAAEYLFARFFDLMSAKVQHLTVLAYEAGWYIVSRRDPFGFAHRRHGRPGPAPFPARKVMRLDLQASSP